MSSLLSFLSGSLFISIIENIKRRIDMISIPSSLFSFKDEASRSGGYRFEVVVPFGVVGKVELEELGDGGRVCHGRIF